MTLFPVMTPGPVQTNIACNRSGPRFQLFEGGELIPAFPGSDQGLLCQILGGFGVSRKPAAETYQTSPLLEEEQFKIYDFFVRTHNSNVLPFLRALIVPVL